MKLRPPSSSSAPSILPRVVGLFDRRVNAGIAAIPAGPRTDAALVRLSTSANNAVLWYVAAAILACTGRRGRRAAVRGLLSLAGASAFANIVAKPVFGGPRPVIEEIPLARRLRVFPTSASFPSGHTASALAFATGVALESPLGGAVVAPVALAVAYSRLHVGAHWLSDVAGGAIIGSGAAVLGRVLLPVRARG